MSVRPPVAETIFDLIVFVVSLVNISNNSRQLDLIGAPNYVEPLYLIYRLTTTTTTSPSPVVSGSEPPAPPPRSISAPEPQQPRRDVSYFSRPTLAPPVHSYCGYESPSELEDGYITPDPTHHRPGATSEPFWATSSASRRQKGGGNNSPMKASMDDILTKGRNLSKRKVSLRDRITCYQWTWFTMTMATGGVANVLHSRLTLLIKIVSAGTIFITICQYGIPNTGPWLLKAMEIIFWIYVGLSFSISAFLYLLLWSTTVFPIHTMTPVWVFPAYPLLLTAPYGANLIAAAVKSGHLTRAGQSTINPISIALASVAVQGTGFLISFMICAAFLYRLMTQKLPRDYQRPGVFISIGPGAFTAAGLVQLANSAPDFFPTEFLGTQGAVAISILRMLAYMAGIWLWGLSCWFFLVSVGSLWKYLRPERKSKLQFQMTWFSFVFPNTALVTATEQLGKAFESDGLKILGCVLTGCIIVVWIVVFWRMLECIWRRELLWPKEAED
ncbi:voltage-dependent anion channel-domain-containing protein [Neurospora hispaniola]|uniref:Voltage-dependent anion channel-domain-containing protein n=1 Tax=Neurospora hispaniola TaxID=588809 RepID=A0AAJ0I5Y4_9PEZI|nr:voltage-dependent anion channel-domain-containing protein [Neurospora hispaniola]